MDQVGSVTCAIALGSNLGESSKTLEQALYHLDQTDGVTLIAQSQWHYTKPVGPPQPIYCNGCALLAVSLSPDALLMRMLAIEAQLGRIRQGKNQPRTIDLDILLMGTMILNTPSLQIPHPRMTERAFVLVPLAEIAPDWVEPISSKTIAQLVSDVDQSGMIGLVE